MAVDPVTPIAGLASEVLVGGTAVIAVGPNPNGGFITNPSTATMPIYVNPVGTATTVANGTNFAIYPGASWTIIPGQTTPTSVNAPDDAHPFSVVSY